MIDRPLDSAASGLAAARLTIRNFTGGAPVDEHGTAVAPVI